MQPPTFGLVAWTAYIIIVAAAGKYLLGYSHLKFLKEMISELKQLALGIIDEKSVNALGMILAFLLLVTYIFSGSFQKLLSLAVDQGGSGAIPTSDFWPALGVLIFFSMFCVIMCAKLRK